MFISLQNALEKKTKLPQNDTSIGSTSSLNIEISQSNSMDEDEIDVSKINAVLIPDE